MPRPPTQIIHSIRHAREYNYPPACWTEALRSVDWTRAACLSEKPGRAVWRVTLSLPGGPVELVVKVHTHRTVLDTIRSKLHLGRLGRQWRGAAKLSRSGFHVSRGLALLRGRQNDRRCDVLVMEATRGVPLLELMAKNELSVKAQHQIARQLGELVSLLDGERLHSKDLKPSNILVEDTDPPVLTIIDSDTVGHRPDHPLLPLVIEPMGVGVLPRRALLARVIKCWAWNEWLNAPFDIAADKAPDTRYERELARDVWRELDRLVNLHGDPTPEHNPLENAADALPAPASPAR